MMEISVKVQKSQKLRDAIKVKAQLERDLKSCMQCRFFYGNSRQCIAKRCVKEEIRRKEAMNKPDMCVGCPYRQSEQYCFPCMKKLLGIKEKENESKIVFKQEENQNG